MRKEFAKELYKKMQENKNIWLLTGDLGFGVWDKIRDDFPNRFINCGAAEQSLLDISVGLALEGKIPFAYSITTFLLYRGFETIRTYIDHENINVKLIGSGVRDSYKHDGFSHDATDIKQFLDPLKNIKQYFPINNEVIPDLVHALVNIDRPSFVSLRK